MLLLIKFIQVAIIFNVFSENFGFDVEEIKEMTEVTVGTQQ